MLNKIWGYIIVISIIFSIFYGTLDNVCLGILNAAKETLNVSLTMLGICSLWLGVMEILDRSDLIKHFKKVASPIIKPLFPNTPKNSKAYDYIILNICANLLGLGSASTPSGLKAVEELKILNHNKDEASDDMIMFLTWNIAGMQFISTNIIALRLSYGSAHPAITILPAFFASLISTISAVIITKYFQRRYKKRG